MKYYPHPSSPMRLRLAVLATPPVCSQGRRTGLPFRLTFVIGLLRSQVAAAITQTPALLCGSATANANSDSKRSDTGLIPWPI
jgi:hypothetical protein